jgi:hypothetical protein
MLRVDLHEIFVSSRFYTDQIYIGRTSSLLSVFNFVLEFADLFKFFLRTLGSDSVDTESHSPPTESMPSETPPQLSQRGVRLYAN